MLHKNDHGMKDHMERMGGPCQALQLNPGTHFQMQPARQGKPSRICGSLHRGEKKIHYCFGVFGYQK